MIPSLLLCGSGSGDASELRELLVVREGVSDLDGWRLGGFASPSAGHEGGGGGPRKCRPGKALLVRIISMLTLLQQVLA